MCPHPGIERGGENIWGYAPGVLLSRHLLYYNISDVRISEKVAGAVS